MKTVCIVGAGPAGLAAAKTFLQTGKFAVTIFEKNDRIGGIWAVDERSTDGFLSPFTPTNLSQFTVGFSDLSWDSVDVKSRVASDTGTSHGIPQVPMFPRAWQVNRYLEVYREKFIPKETIQLRTEITRAERVASSIGKSNPIWRISSRDPSGEHTQHVFDYLVIASGFFARPRPLARTVISLPRNGTDLPVKVVHSSAFRSLRDLFPEDREVNGQAILLIGGGNSSGEAAAAIAHQLSSSQFSPTPVGRDRFQGCRVIHVTPRPLYALPPFTPADEQSRTFMPLDLNFYNLAKRPVRPIVGGAGLASAELRHMLHSGLQASIGSDQSDLGAAALVAPKGSERGTVQVALSENYAEFVRSGILEVVGGRVSAIGLDGEGAVYASVLSSDKPAGTLRGIGAVVYATGFSPAPALNFLDESVKRALHFDANSTRLPLILEQWQTMSDAVPDIAFLGFYEGPYWPIIEMQARLSAMRWLGDVSLERPKYEEPQTLLELRRAMQDRQLDVPQYWFGDYAGYMEEMAAALGLKRNNGPFQDYEGAVSPGRYLWTGDDGSEADKTMLAMSQTWTECSDGKYVPRAAFRALHGHWEIVRRIDSKNGAFPSGTLTGVAAFHPRSPTTDATGKAFDLEYLYIESGTFTTSAGLRMDASRRYVYRYSELSDELSIWFVKPENDFEVDYLFHNLNFAKPEESRKEGTCVARADHLCVKDMYWTEYRLPIKGVALPSFSIRHTVKGPDKDYVSMTEYARPRK